MNTNVASWIATHTPDVIVLIGGVNDLTTESVATTKARLETLLDTIAATPTAPHVILSTTPINTSDSADCIAYNAEIPGVATAKGATFVDAGSQIVAGSGLIADNVHPNPRGYEALAASLAAAYITWSAP
jgi:lysophospholipase L1-like esterase